MTITGLPAGRAYTGQHLMHIPSGEARTIAGQSYASALLVHVRRGRGEAGPFSAAPATGDLHCPVP